MSKVILITGADGFIGSHLVEQLVKKGAKVKAFHYYNSWDNLGWLHYLPKTILKEIELINGGRVPLLCEALDSFPDLRFNIDIKTEDALENTEKIIKEIKCFSWSCLASFSSSRLNRIRKLAGPEVCTSSGQMDIFKLICKSLGINLRINTADCAQIPIKQWGVPILTKRFLRIAKKENKLVHVWTIDNKEEMFKLIDFGVDGIMTDKPSILKQAMTERGFSDLGNSP